MTTDSHLTSMDRYEISGQIGDGSFGRVMKATLKASGELVAIKHIKKKFKTWKACVDLREVQSLRVILHPNIVSIREVIWESDESLYFVFEYMPDGTLYELIRNSARTRSLTKAPGDKLQSILSHEKIVSIMKQILSGVAYIHHQGYFHRDIKPENILLHGDVVKVADFGLAREVRSQLPLTYYVSTRWYRAPEVILHSHFYGSPIDMFALGLLLSELYTLQPLFPGTSEIDQLHRMFALLGPPSVKSWNEGIQLMIKMNVQFSASTIPDIDVVEYNLAKRMESSCRRYGKGCLQAAANLICRLIQWSPTQRPNAEKALDHEYFGICENNNTLDIQPPARPHRSSYSMESTVDPIHPWQRRSTSVKNIVQHPKGPSENVVHPEVSLFESEKLFSLGSNSRLNNRWSNKDDHSNEFSDYLKEHSSSNKTAELAASQRGLVKSMLSIHESYGRSTSEISTNKYYSSKNLSTALPTTSSNKRYRRNKLIKNRRSKMVAVRVEARTAQQDLVGGVKTMSLVEGDTVWNTL